MGESYEQQQEEIRKFKKDFPINTFAKDVFNFCIEHPIVAKSVFRVSDDTNSPNIAKFTFQLTNQKFTLESFSKLPTHIDRNFLPEYYAVIDTMRNAMANDMWNRNTGAIDRARQEIREFFTEKNRTYKEFEDAIKLAIREAIQTKEPRKIKWKKDAQNGEKSYQTEGVNEIREVLWKNPE